MIILKGFFFYILIFSFNFHFQKFYGNNINNMNGMFWECDSLKELNLNNFNTNNVTDMSSMFSGCSSLKELTINNFNTNNVIDMKSMFLRCSNKLIMKIKAQYKNIKEEAFINFSGYGPVPQTSQKL